MTAGRWASATPAPAPCPCGRRLTRRNYVDATLRAARDFLADVLGDGPADRGGWLQRADARGKLLGVLLLLLAGSLAQRLPTLLGLHLLAVALAASAGLPVGAYLRRVWLGVPLFTAVVALPAALSWVSGGTPVLWLWREGGLALTDRGLLSVLRLVLRTGTALGYLLLLAWTTPWHEVYRALGSLRVPPLLIAALMMCHRYLVVLVQQAEELFAARRSRPGAIAGRAGAAGGRLFVAGAAGVLLHRAHDLAGEIEDAMRARGFRGRVRLLPSGRRGRCDWLLPAAASLAALTALLGDRLLPTG